jgi:hypothetical protein
MRLTPPPQSKATNLTVRVDGAFLARLDGLLAVYRKRWPSESGMTRSWLVTELLAHSMEDAERELESGK